MPFVATDHPKLKDLGKLVKNLQLCFNSVSKVRGVISSAPIVFCRSARKINDYIVRSNVYPIERKVGSCRCRNPRCQVCTSIQVTGNFSSIVTKSRYKIYYIFNCKRKCFINLPSCITCGKQYTGITVGKYRKRKSNYKTDARKSSNRNIKL